MTTFLRKPTSATRAAGWTRAARVLAVAAAGCLLAACERPPIVAVQHGYRGTGMDQVYNPRILEKQATLHTAPADTPSVPSEGPKASTVFQNVQVLGDLSVAEFTRLMVSMTAWVSPEQGCTYCHVGANFADDGIYTKVVSRRMLQMTSHINTTWKNHVAETGVTCYTCHRGAPVPNNIWFTAPQSPANNAYAGNKAGQNLPAPTAGLASLPYDAFTAFLSQGNEVRVIGTSALPTTNRKSIKQTEWTYGLMMHMSQALGVNCSYCHNTRSFAQWEQSTPQRGVSYYGIRMVRDLNNNYLDPLLASFPANRLGPLGDVPKTNCATCHQGAYKPLYGQSLFKTHPELARVSVTAVLPGSAASAAAVSDAVPGAPAAEGAVPVVANGATLFFAVGSPALSADANEVLKPVIDVLKADSNAKATVSGYNSASGDAAQNEELAKQRAFAVRDALTAAGIAEDRIVMDKPQTTEANVTGEDAQARRVEVAVK